MDILCSWKTLSGRDAGGPERPDPTPAEQEMPLNLPPGLTLPALLAKVAA